MICHILLSWEMDNMGSVMEELIELHRIDWVVVKAIIAKVSIHLGKDHSRSPQRISVLLNRGITTMQNLKQAEFCVFSICH